jgi:hypothetical protein
MMTVQDRQYHAVYEAMPADVRSAVDKAVRAAVGALRESGMQAPMDDRIECLVGAVARYAMESDFQRAVVE